MIEIKVASRQEPWANVDFFKDKISSIELAPVAIGIKIVSPSPSFIRATE